MEEDEAALLAELMAISNKSAASRFVNDNDDGVSEPSQEKRSPTAQEERQQFDTQTNEIASSQLQEQQGRTGQVDDDILDELLADDVGDEPEQWEEAEELPSPCNSDPDDNNNDNNNAFQETTGAMGGAGNFQQQSTFQGERGGDAQDEELLALLRGVSAKSGAADRFANSDDDNETTPAETMPVVEPPAPAPKPKKNTSKELPPWKRPKNPMNNSTNTADVVVAAPATPQPPTALPQEAIVGGGGNFKQESTFQGERGGAAEDAELLALLRGVSAKSGGADRFASSDDGNEEAPEPVVEPPAPAPAPKPKKATKDVPPWKRPKNPMKNSTNTADVVIAAPAPPKPESTLPQEAIMGGGGNFQQQSTFQGERGGEAQDEELLALLRGVSAKSGASNRFSEDEPGSEPVPEPTPAPKPKPTATATTKPRKPTSTQNGDMGGKGNFKQESTFQGERGGAAEDAELLALLRGVSAKSGGVDRFASSDDSDEKAPTPVVEPPAPAPAPEPTPELVPEPALMGGGGNFKQESTFQGERGGEAQDEELLALLRGVSAKSGGSNRFANEEDPAASAATPQVQPPSTPKQVSPIKSTTTSSMPSPFPTSEPEEEVVVTKESLSEHIVDSNWKVRKRSFAVLRQMIVDAANGAEPSGVVDGNAVFAGLDQQVAGFLLEKNANALEEALQLGIAFGDYCQGGSSAELAESMAVSLVKGAGFTSPRPKAVKLSQALVLKMMEVGEDKASINAMVGVLLEQGLTSKKPKIVQASSAILLEAAHSFGAAALPLSTIKPHLSKLLSNSNKKVRDTGMEVVAEFCRALGGKVALADVIEQMKKPQQNDLDAMLEKQPQAAPAKIGLRCRKAAASDRGGSANEDLAALQANAAELAAELFANRPAVNLLAELKQTDYAKHLKLAKWSEKVTGLKIILQCGGEVPYKLVPPSSANNYVPLIIEMKGLLSHTHFAVVGKSLEVLSMLAQGAGEKLYPNLRPLLPQLFSLSKDKKLTKSVSACLDAFFGNVLSFEHLLDPADAIPEATEERKQKNALARATALDFLARCITRLETAGSRGKLTPATAKSGAIVASTKLGDSDANVRKAALNVLKTLQSVEDTSCRNAIEPIIAELETSQPRAFKQLSSGGASKPSPAKASTVPKRTVGSPTKAKPVENRSRNSPSPQKGRKVAAPRSPTKSVHRPMQPPPSPKRASGAVVSKSPTPEVALEYVESMGIPNWDLEEDDGGVLAGFQSTKWLARQNAVKALGAFMSSRAVDQGNAAMTTETSFVLSFVKENTKGFKETNFNINKSIMEFFMTMCQRHEVALCVFPLWAATDAATLATNKIADKKLSQTAQALLSSLCAVQEPHVILGACYKAMASIKSPVAHEEFLKWMNTFSNDFGVAVMMPGLNDVVDLLLQFCGSKNPKVKKAALAVMGEFHAQLGPAFQAVTFSSLEDQSLRAPLEQVFEQNAYDPALCNSDWPRKSIALTSSGPDDHGDVDQNPFQLDVPKFDLIGALPGDCITKMGSKDGKTAWKARKAAMEDVEAALKKCSGLLDTSRLRPLVDLLRALRDRLSDSQSNLKPVAARLMGVILSKVDATAQGKLGKVAYGPLINSAMNDNRKVMHDASMEALSASTHLSKLEGEGPNAQALEPFIAALVGELDESDFKSAGISDVLNLTKALAVDLPDLDSVSSQGGNTLGGRFAKVLVQGLTSSKAEIRSSSESLLAVCVTEGMFNISTVKKIAARQKPAIQRAIAPIVSKIGSSVENSEGDVATKPLGEARTGRVQSPIKRERKPTTAPRAGPSSRVQRNTRSRVEPIRRSEPPATVEADDDSHSPLVINVSSVAQQKSKAAVRSMTWPEYPEVPSGILLLSALKKAWGPLIPAQSTKKLFPDGGIKKQDDAKEGFEVLKKAILVDKAEESCYVVEQFGFIWKWIAYVLCCKESTVGLQGLLQVLSQLVDHLRNVKYELTDSESTLLIPFIFDKASAAKGRFKDSFMDLMKQLKAEELVSTKRMGPLVCVAVIESSTHPKARYLACKQCYECVEMIGLAGIGKKGVLAAAKSLSEEKLQDNRNVLLELMALLVSRMNNDMQRFARICGASLSGKARSLLEEKIQKGLSVPSSQAQKSRNSLSKHSPVPKASASRRAIPGQSSRVKQADRRGATDDSFTDELPALDLRFGAKGIPPPTTDTLDAGELSQPVSPAASPPSPSFQNPPSSLKKLYPDDHRHAVGKGTNLFASSDAFKQPVEAEVSDVKVAEGEPLGAAASLRARLLKIRERNKADEGIEVELVDDSYPDPVETHEEPVEDDDEPLLSPINGAPSTNQSPIESTVATERLGEYLSSIKGLLSRETPLPEEDPDVLTTANILKNLHAAISEQPHLSVDLDEASISDLRKEVNGMANEVVEVLTGLIAFGFNCHSIESSAGISVPLLSVDLASLMAIFRSEDISKLIRVEDLTVLIKESAKALLDQRLAGGASNTALDEGTSTQMVRAINKLAVQAATGATRHYSFEALITLQQQLGVKANASDDPVFTTRLSRVVSKLFARVVKAEEGSKAPFASSNVDMEAIVCFLEDALVACGGVEKSEISADGIEATKGLVKSLVISILKAHGSSITFCNLMDELEIDTASSALGQLVTTCSDELGLKEGAGNEVEEQRAEAGRPESKVEEASESLERTVAVAGSGASEEKQTTSTAAKSSMSERIKNLRSKLNATEAAVQSAVEPAKPSNPREVATKVTNTAGASSASARAFRDRLAAAQEKRTASSAVDSTISPVPTESAGSRAAALRARLKAVKKKTQLAEF